MLGRGLLFALAGSRGVRALRALRVQGLSLLAWMLFGLRVRLQVTLTAGRRQGALGVRAAGLTNISQLPMASQNTTAVVLIADCYFWAELCSSLYGQLKCRHAQAGVGPSGTGFETSGCAIHAAKIRVDMHAEHQTRSTNKKASHKTCALNMAFGKNAVPIKATSATNNELPCTTALQNGVEFEKLGRRPAAATSPP